MPNKLLSKSQFSRFQLVIITGLLTAVGLTIVLLARANALDTVEGELITVHVDPKPGHQERHDYFVKTSAGDLLSLVFENRQIPKNIIEAKGRHIKVRAKGLRKNRSLSVPRSGSVSAILPKSLIPAAFAEGPIDKSSVSTTGQHKVAVIMFNFKNNKIQPFTTEQVRQSIFTASDSTAAFYKEQSYNQLGLTGSNQQDGDIFGWSTVDIDDTAEVTYSDGTQDCDYYAFKQAALTQAQAIGLNPSLYDHIILLSPYIPTCRGRGYGEVNNKYSSANHNQILENKGTISHELGHNLGLNGHAAVLVCKDSNEQKVPLSSNCYSAEYWDPFDAMGGASIGSVGHFSAFRKDFLSWLSPANTQIVNTTGEYTLNSLNTQSNQVQSIKIPHNGQQYFYLEQRERNGFYGWSELGESAFTGILIRRAPEISINTGIVDNTRSGLINMHPFQSQFDSRLKVGESFFDPLSHTLITLMSKNANQSRVKIEFNATQPPPSKKPDLIISNISWTPTNPFNGQAVTFQATVKNQGEGEADGGEAGTSLNFCIDCDSANPVRLSEGFREILQPGESKVITGRKRCISPECDQTYIPSLGSHTISVAADDANYVDESNENNNELTSTMTVLPISPPPPVTPPTQPPTPPPVTPPPVQPPTPPTPPPPASTGDLNNDGRIDIFDLSIILSRWNTSNAAADLNRNGKVDIFDLSILLSNWVS